MIGFLPGMPVVALCLSQLCFPLAQSLVLVYPAMYASGYLLTHVNLKPSLLLWRFAIIIVAAVVFPTINAVPASFLLLCRRSSVRRSGAAVNTCLAIACATLTLAPYKSPASSSLNARSMLSLVVALPLIDILILTVPPVRRKILSSVTSSLRLTQSS